MIAMKKAANGATYMTAARITRIVARDRRRLVADNAIADSARTGPNIPSPDAESTLNHCASFGAASVFQANTNPSENSQIKKPATMAMTMRRTPLVLLYHSPGMNDAFVKTPRSEADAYCRLHAVSHTTAQSHSALGRVT
jgi:hypothetical protein